MLDVSRLVVFTTQKHSHALQLANVYVALTYLQSIRQYKFCSDGSRGASDVQKPK